MADAKRHVVEAKVEDLPLILMAVEHDGPGPALAKQFKRTVAKRIKQPNRKDQNSN
jgi:hypothetical protein